MTDYCQLCLAENVVAVVGGPTCKHQPKHGLAWWPENWQAMNEYERVEWLEQTRRKSTPRSLIPALRAGAPSALGPIRPISSSEDQPSNT